MRDYHLLLLFYLISLGPLWPERLSLSTPRLFSFTVELVLQHTLTLKNFEDYFSFVLNEF